MGRKINPISFRLQQNKKWLSKWITKKEYPELLHEDLKIREFIEKNFGTKAGVAKIEIERSPGIAEVTIYTSRPGVIIGRGGTDIEDLKQALQKLSKNQLKININEVTNPEADPKLIALNIASQIEKRIAYKRVIKKAIAQARQAGASGIKIKIAGRLGGAEISRVETFFEGSIPTATIKANIDYQTATAKTTYGIIGIKVWIYKK